DKLAIPGLINTHTHAAMTLTRGLGEDIKLMEWLEDIIWPFEAGLNAEDVYWGTKLALVEMLQAGITTFADMYFFMGKVAEAVAEAGMRGVLSRGLVGAGPNPEQALEESRALLEGWHNGAEGRIRIMLGPHAPYTCSPGYLGKVMEMAGQYDVGLHIHLAETAQEVAQILTQYGKRPVAYLADLGILDFPVLAAHCVHLNDEEIGLLAEKGVRVAHNPHSNMKLASGIAPVVKMIEAGIKIGFGTDGAGSNNKLDLLEEMRTGVLLQKVANNDPTVLTLEEALSMATCWGAEVAGLQEVGCIKQGWKADLVLLDLSSPHLQPDYDLAANLIFAARAGDVHTVIVDGRILLDAGEMKGLDLERISYEVNQRSRILVEKMNSR
ncbi:MAG: amidohydrolase, partial [Halanaerobium sp.]|nr:amidohydrolase [Halanaerobium sp.]